jgi:ATP-dependent helicase/nuclease subunit B
MAAETKAALTKVHITFGLKADGALPEIASDAMGQVTVGPLGLLSFLETQLGIPSSDVSFTTRLIQYLSCIDQADDEGVFYHASFEADPFSVARTLLQWRDYWYLAGWSGKFDNDVPSRLADMAALEKLATGNVDPGLGQRVQDVIALLADSPVAVASIHLRDKFVDIPALWRRLIEAINVSYVEAEGASPQGEQGSDLLRLQHHLLQTSSERIALRGDGSVIVLRADAAQDSSPLTAHLAQQWLSKAPDKTLAILAEVRGDLLDEALEATNSPRLGFGALSPSRPVFQVLPLACELLWEPLNPTVLFQFLSHSVGPIPARFCERLAQTVASLPGIGSDEWEAAVASCLESEEERTRKRHEENIRYWLEPPKFAPQTGVDSVTLAERAQRVADWLMGARAATDNPSLQSLYFIALNQTLEFVLAIDRLKAHGREILTRDNVRRLMEDVRGTGAPVADRRAEVYPGQSRALRVEHAGAFHGPVDKVIWWDCQASDRIHRWPWSKTERTALKSNGVNLQTEEEQLVWLGKAWLRPILSAREQFTLILHNDTERHHPVWDQISSLNTGLSIIPFTENKSIEALGIPQTAIEARALPAKVRWWQLPVTVDMPKREFESYTSLDAYIHSPYQWLMRYAAKIRPGSLATVSDGNLLKGSLAHRLYEEFLNSNPDISAITAERVPAWVDEHAPALLQREGAVLLEPGRQAECERFITTLQESLVVLVNHLQQARVVQVQMELEQEGLFAGGKLRGSIDLLATCADGREAIVDIKFGGKNYRRNSLRKGSYLQLATYAQLRRNVGAKSPPALSYFIINDAHMLSLDHNLFPEAERIVPEGEEDWLQYWQRFEQTWRWRKDQFDRSLFEVTVSDTELTEGSLPDETCLAMPEASDGFNDYAVITGWGANE